MLGEEDAESVSHLEGLIFGGKGSGDILDGMSYDRVPFTYSEMILNVWLSQKRQLANKALRPVLSILGL